VLASSEIEITVDRLFRQSGGQMVSTLTRIFGAHHLELAETVLQDSFIKALQVWPEQGVPENPKGWLYQVAKHQALDVVRRNRFLIDKEAEVRQAFDGWGDIREAPSKGAKRSKTSTASRLRNSFASLSFPSANSLPNYR
jgi:RNA polymerase sigma-70 factor (ECF subfamily)